MIRQPDRIGDLAHSAPFGHGETRIAAETTRFDLRVADIAAPAEGDTIAVDGEIYVIQGEPIRDAERLVCTIEAGHA